MHNINNFTLHNIKFPITGFTFDVYNFYIDNFYAIRFVYSSAPYSDEIKLNA